MPIKDYSKLVLFNREAKNEMVLQWLSVQSNDTVTSLRLFYASTLDCPLREIPEEFDGDQSLEFVWFVFSCKIKAFHNRSEKQRKKNK